MRPLALALLLVLVLGPSSATGAPAPLVSFTSLRIAPAGGAPSIGVAPDGFLRAVYKAVDGLWYARQTATGWTKTRITSVSVAGTPILGLDDDGKAHVAYQRGDAEGVFYSTDRFGSWGSRQVSDDATDADISMAVNAFGEVHIVFTRRESLGLESRQMLMWATNRRGYWTLLPVTDPPVRGVDAWPSVSVDDAGRTHIAMLRYYPTDQGIRYLTNATGSWVTRSLTADGADRYPKIDIAADGSVVVAFYGEQPWPSGIGIATNRTGSWVVTRNVASGGSSGFDFELDRDSKIHLAVCARWTTERFGGWTTQLASEGSCDQASMALGPDRLPRIALNPAFGSALDYPVDVIVPVGVWARQSLGADDPHDPDAAVAGDGSSHVVWNAQRIVGLQYATNRTGSWLVERISTGFYDAQPSIAVDAAGAAHIAYWTMDTDTEVPTGVRYATNASGTWVTESVTTAADHWTTIALGPDGSPWLAITSAAGLRVLHLVGTVWQPVALPAWAADAWGGRIAVDAAGKVHLTMYQDPAAAAAYATNASGSWAVTVFDDADRSIPDLALDASGRAHVAYMDETGLGKLRYATNATGTWVTTTVWSRPNSQFGWPSLGLDPSGTPWISVVEQLARVIVATRTGTSWSVEELLVERADATAIAPEPGGGVGLALTETSQPLVWFHR